MRSRRFLCGIVISYIFTFNLSVSAQQAGAPAAGTSMSHKPGSAIGKTLPSTTVEPAFSGSITLSLHAEEAAELLLTDPTGRRVGTDSLTGISYEEIPNASYGNDSIDDPTDDSSSPAHIDDKNIEFSPLAQGTYYLAVIGSDAGAYGLDFSALDSKYHSTQSTLDAVPLTRGSKHVYAFTVPIPSGAKFPISGAFAGDGKSPNDVNQLLSYANPLIGNISLPANTKSFPLLISYSARAIGNSFSAKLNGENVANLFHPAPGSFEMVSIPLHSGANALELSVQGKFSTGIATDVDRLIFMVAEK